MGDRTVHSVGESSVEMRNNKHVISINTPSHPITPHHTTIIRSVGHSPDVSRERVRERMSGTVAGEEEEEEEKEREEPKTGVTGGEEEGVLASSPLEARGLTGSSSLVDRLKRQQQPEHTK